MLTSHPRQTLFLMLSVAVVVLVGGILLSRQQEVLRIDRDREALRAFAAKVHSQIQRLETVYQGHLLHLGMALEADAKLAGRVAADIEGILQVSLLHRSPSTEKDFHEIISAGPGSAPPLPTFAPAIGYQVPVVTLDELQLFSEASGWIDEPGKPLMFHVQQNSSEVAVITVSRSVVERAIREWMVTWADAHFDPLRIDTGSDQLRDNRGVLVGTGDPGNRQPDLLQPLPGRFGSIELASWEDRKTVVKHHPVTLAASCTLSVILALLAIIVSITQKREQLVAAQKVSFVNNVSHELRTPLSNIMLNIDLAIEMAKDSPDQSQSRLGLVRSEARRLGRLIDNVLTFSRAEKGKLEISRTACVPKEIISSVIEQFLPSFKRRGLKLKRVDENTESSCLCDPDALTQILGNLLSNVDKYVHQGEVGIHSRLADGELRVQISDEGPGIPAEATERIFKPFERIRTKVNEMESGTGLGLSISRDLALRLGGTLTLLAAKPGGGCCFELRIPAPALSEPED